MSREHGPFVLLSINHEAVALEIRERYAVDDRRLESLYKLLDGQPEVSEALVLNTCNRFELYAQLSDATAIDRLVELLASFFAERSDSLRLHLRIRRGQEAVQHLIEVAAGLRSQITGEAEIFGQVKEAYALCHKLGYAGKVINRVFQKGFQAAKFIRHATSVGEGQINISNVAVELATKIFGSLDSVGVLSLGTGEIGEKTVRALRSRGARSFGIASRSPERAEAVATEWGGAPHAVADLESYLSNYDIVIASIGTGEPVVTSKLVTRCAAKRKDRPLFLIDLGLPRNIDKACEDHDNVFLYNLDDLAAIAAENLAERKNALQHSQSIAAQKSAHIWESLVKRGYTV